MRYYGGYGPPGRIGKARSLEDRFRDNVQEHGPIPAYAPYLGCCYQWAGYTINGYGVLGYRYKKLYVHRLVWEWNFGPIPDGVEIDHRCRNRLCVRPDHLRLVTPKQNVENHGGPNRANTSGFRGAQRTRSGKWQARVVHNGKVYVSGTVTTAAEAGEIARLMRIELHTHNDLDRV
jgi:hypothetical protein